MKPPMTKPTSLIDRKERSSPPADTPFPISKTALAKVAGVLYLAVAVLGGFSQLYVRSTVVVPGDAVATTENISSSATLFRLGLVTDLVSITAFLLVALALYVLLNPISKQIASTMVIINAISVAIMSANMINHAAALMVATGTDYSTAAGTAASSAQVMLFLDLHSQGYLVAEIFFGLWLLPLGYLVFESGYFPKALGLLLMIGSASYLVDVAATLLFPGAGPDLSLVLATPAAISEVVFLLWLIVKGANTGDERVLAAAREKERR